jgi:hypothetical protein
MTAAYTTRKSTFPGSGSTGPVTFNWRILATSDIIVTKITDATGARAPLSASTDYSCSLVSSGLSGGSITLTSTLDSGYTLLVEGNTPITQTIPYRNQGRFAPESHETSYDKLTLISQEFYDRIRRSAKITADVTAITGELYLPAPTASKLIGWNAAGTGMDNYDNPAAAMAGAQAAEANVAIYAMEIEAIAAEVLSDRSMTIAAKNAAAASAASIDSNTITSNAILFFAIS